MHYMAFSLILFSWGGGRFTPSRGKIPGGGAPLGTSSGVYAFVCLTIMFCSDTQLLLIFSLEFGFKHLLNILFFFFPQFFEKVICDPRLLIPWWNHPQRLCPTLRTIVTHQLWALCKKKMTSKTNL